MAYVELHAHSAYSFLDGASTPQEMAAAAAVHGYEAIALTDHDGIWGAMEFAHACKGLGVKAITGAELTVVERTEPAHLTLLVQDRHGYRNLCRLLTLAHEGTRDYSRSGATARRPPRTTIDQLERHAEGLLCLSGCARDGAVAGAVERGKAREAERIARRLLAAFGRDRFRVELQRPCWRRDRARNRALCSLAEQVGVACVATGNVHSHHPDRARLQDAFVAARLLLTLDQTEPERRGNRSSVMAAPAEMAERFHDRPDAVAETARLAERIEFDLTRDLGYRYPGSEDPLADEKLAKLCRGRLDGRYRAAERAEAGARLDEELRVIRTLGLSGFFLLHHDMLELAREVAAEVRGRDSARTLLPPGRGRGSSVSSIVCYLTGLSHIDPIRNRLFLGRFLNEEISALPDIDLDFPRDIREKLIPRVHERYGAERAALVGAFATYRWKGAVRDLGKALGLPAGEIERLARATDVYGDADGFARGVEEVIGSRRARSPRWRALIELAPEAYGLPRHVSQHPGGMVIATEPLIDLCPVQPSAMEGRNLVQWDKDSCADAGFLKIDLLGLGMLSAVERCIDEVARVRGERIDLSRVPYDDAEVYRVIQRAETTGVFQIESRAQMQSIRRTKPASLDDLTVQVALVRPGPIQGGAVHPYIDRREKRRVDPSFKVPYAHPSLEPVLEETLGVIVFQDQVLEVAMALAGFGAGEAEGLRRAMSRKRSDAAMAVYQQRFVEGAVERGVDHAVAESVFEQVRGFSGFGFPKAHAAAFGLLAYQSTWLRVHYGPEFLCALLNEQPMGFYPPDSLVHEAQLRGMTVLAPDVNRSFVECRVERPQDGNASGTGPVGLSDLSAAGPRRKATLRATRARRVADDDSTSLAVRVGLGYVLGVREEEVRWLVEERERGGGYFDAGDLAARSGVGRDTLERLAWSGACEGLPRREVLWQLGVVTPGRAVPGGVQLSLPLEAPEPPALREQTPWERLVADYGSFRISIDQHPLELLRPDLPERAVTSEDLERLPDGQSITIAGLVVARQRPATANGITFMLLEDELGTINLVVMPQVYERHRLTVRAEPFVIVEGRLEKRAGVINVVVQSLRPLERLDLPRAEVKHIEPPVGRETGREAIEETAGTGGEEQLAAAAGGDLRAVLPVPHSFGRRGR